MRRQRFQRPPLRGFQVRIQRYDWCILWWLDGAEVVVSYIGPSSF